MGLRPSESLKREAGRGFAPGPAEASSQTILQARSTTLAQILPSYIIPSRSFWSSSTTISAPVRKTSIATSRSFSSTTSDVWDYKLPTHVSSVSTPQVFRRQTPFIYYPGFATPTIKVECIMVSCRPPNAFQVPTYSLQ